MVKDLHWGQYSSKCGFSFQCHPKQIGTDEDSALPKYSQFQIAFRFGYIETTHYTV